MFAATKNALADVPMKWLNGWHITAMPQMEMPGLPLQSSAIYGDPWASLYNCRYDRKRGHL
jgi:hypothetical protein